MTCRHLAYIPKTTQVETLASVSYMKLLYKFREEMLGVTWSQAKSCDHTGCGEDVHSRTKLEQSGMYFCAVSWGLNAASHT